MALRIPKPASSGLFKDGYKMAQGVEEAVIKNITAIKELSQITQTSFGPNGRNKIVVNSLEKLFVTNDAATMIREIEVVHPAAKVVVMASQQQESELGDATNLVIVLAAQLLAKAEELLKMGLHPSEVLQGYEIALKKALEILETLPVETVENIKESEAVLKAITTSVGSKLNGYEDFIGNLIHEAALEVMPKTVKNFNVDSVRVVKILGGNINESRVVKGMVLGREPESLATRVEKAKVAIFSCPLDTSATETKGTVLIHNAKEMMDFTKGEEKQVEQIFKELSDAGVKVLVTGGTVGELALHYINRFGMMAIKVQSKFDLRRLCQVVDGTALARLGVPMAEEMGYCEVVESIEIGSDRVTVFRQEQERTKTITVLLRGATRNFLDDVERAIDDGVNTVKALTKDGRLLAGAGASEMQLSKQLHNFGQKTPGIHQHAIKKFAEALEIVPRILGETSGMNSIEILSKIHAAHYSSETVSHQGINIESESASILDAVENGILDSYAVKKNAIELATNSALTVLQVDQIIMSKPAGGPKMPKNNPNWDED